MDTRREIDLHCLDLRYAEARLADARAVERLARSIEQCGQLAPCIVVPDAARLVVIDGYRRIAALRRLGRDTATVQPWLCDLAQGLLNILVQSKSRPFMAIEEALLLRELVNRLQLSQREVSVGKSKVLDIRDTIERHRAEGYFLVAYPQPANSLVEHLLAIANRGTRADWWDRAQIETRLRNNLDLLARFSDVVFRAEKAHG